MGVMAISVSALESNLTDIKCEVSTNEKRIEETETHISAVEAKFDKTESASTSVTKWIAHLERKTDDLENCGS